MQKSNKKQKLKKQVKQNFLKYITGGFGIVAALAWNDAIKDIIRYLFPISRDTVLAKLIYAVIVTFVLVIISIYLTRLLKKKD